MAKCITIKQPWASLIVEGIKDIENRTWKCPQKYIGRRVLIHAGKSILRPQECNFTDAQSDNIRVDMRTRILYSELPTGAIMGSVEIVDCVISHPSIWAERSYFNITSNPLPFNEEDEPDYIIYNWVLANPIKFDKPIPCKGKLSFWDYPNILAEPEEENGELFCHCSLPVKEENQVSGYSRFGFYCRYCGGKWYK